MFVILAWFILELSILWLLEKAMATHSSILAWKILWMEEPGGLPSMGSHRVGHNWSDLAAAAVYYGCDYYASSVQSLNCVCLFVTPWTAACQASLSITNSCNLLKLMSIELVMPSNHLILPSPSSPAFNPSWHQGVFPVSLLLVSSGQNIGVSASVLPMNVQGWFPLGLTGFISLLFKGLSRVFSITTVQNHQFFSAQLSL